MLDGRVRIERHDTTKREDGIIRAAIVIFQPIERRAPSFFLHFGPAVRKPEFRAAIAAIGDEGAIFAIAHRPRGDAERPEQYLMARQLIVETEARTVMPDKADAA